MSDNSKLLTDLALKRTNRRRFMGYAGASGLGIIGASHLAAAFNPVLAQGDSDLLTDPNILNFALNLEYLEAEFYLRAAFGRGLSAGDITGQGTEGPVFGGRQVPFSTMAIRLYAEEIARDEELHVQFLRAALGDARVARPAINIGNAFTRAARAAGLVGPTENFDAYANENNFLLAAFIFEDVGVTAYKGAAPFIDNKTFLEAAAGILAVEAYHASEIRTILYMREFFSQAQAISDARDSLDGPSDLDQGIGDMNTSNIVPADENAIAFSRTPQQVLNIVYLGGAANRFGFFPARLNGAIR